MTTMVNPVWVQGKWRLRNDDGTLSTATWIANQNTSAEIALDTKFRLRVSWGDSAGANQNNASGAITLQYRIGSGSWVTVAGSTAVKTSTSTNVADGATETTSRVSAPTGVSGGMLIAEFDSNGSAATRTLSNQYCETEFCLELDSAQLSGSETITFQVLRGGATFASVDSVPTLATPEAAAITGTLAASETGSDTFSGSAKAIVSGSLAVSETGSDVFASSGTVADGDEESVGSMSASESGADVFSGSGDVIVSGSLSVAESATDTASINGSVLVSGALSVSESGQDLAQATGSVIVGGSLSVAEAGVDVLASSGGVVVSGSLSAVEVGADQFAGVGEGITSEAAGSLNASESGADAFASLGGVVVFGAFAGAEQTDSAAIDGNVIVSGSASLGESGQDGFAGTGSAIIPPSTGNLAAVESADVISITGILLVNGSLSAQEIGLDQIKAFGDGIAAPTPKGGTLSVNADQRTVRFGPDQRGHALTGNSRSSVVADRQGNAQVRKEARKVAL